MHESIYRSAFNSSLLLLFIDSSSLLLFDYLFLYLVSVSSLFFKRFLKSLYNLSLECATMSAPHLTILAPKFLVTHFICKRLRLIFTTKSPTPLLKRCGCGSNYQMSSKYSLFSSSIISNGKHSAQPSGILSSRSTISFPSSFPSLLCSPSPCALQIG